MFCRLALDGSGRIIFSVQLRNIWSDLAACTASVLGNTLGFIHLAVSLSSMKGLVSHFSFRHDSLCVIVPEINTGRPRSVTCVLVLSMGEFTAVRTNQGWDPRRPGLPTGYTVALIKSEPRRSPFSRSRVRTSNTSCVYPLFLCATVAVSRTTIEFRPA